MLNVSFMFEEVVMIKFVYCRKPSNRSKKCKLMAITLSKLRLNDAGCKGLINTK